MSVRRAQAEIDSSEFTDWIAFYRLEPWGSEIDDLRAGSIVSMIANVNRDVKKRPEPFGLLEFIPWADRRSAENDSSEEILLEDPREQAALIRAALYRRK
ncbi:phage tail assembly protein T [Burkholderia anthina]|uniref:phage tail assembly protein T n=1 Tax=Burkholderia anthina TaxID=179879 RepID=UPI001AA0297F|nr:DUF4035 domain-containing protein [Burkholderia anthina]QTD91758.1 DUF4035 domain-containing protein [Burkholderia anthina]